MRYEIAEGERTVLWTQSVVVGAMTLLGLGRLVTPNVYQLRVSGPFDDPQRASVQDWLALSDEEFAASFRAPLSSSDLTALMARPGPDIWVTEALGHEHERAQRLADWALVERLPLAPDDTAHWRITALGAEVVEACGRLSMHGTATQGALYGQQ